MKRTLGISNFLEEISSLSHSIFFLYFLALSLQFSSVTQLCLTLCDSMDWSTPGFPVDHHSWSLLKLMSIESVMPSNHLTLCHPLLLLTSCLQSFPTSGSFPICQSFASGGQSIGTSASASVLPMNSQDWFPLEWTGLISLQSKELSSLLQHHSSKASFL